MNVTFDSATRRRISAALFGSQALYSTATVGSFALMPIVVERLGGDPVLVGLPATMSLLGRAGSAYPVGWLMDRFGRRPGLAIGYLVGTLGFMLAVVSVQIGWLWLFLFAPVLLGFARSSADQSRYVAAEVAPPEGRARAIGILVFANTVGAILGPLMMAPSGAAAEQSGLSYFAGPWVIGALLGLLASFSIFLFLRPDPVVVTRHALGRQGYTDEKSAPILEIFASTRVRLAVFALMVSQAVMSLLMVITPLAMTHHDHGVQAVSWVIMGHTVGMYGLASVSGWMIDRVGRLPMVGVGAFMLVAASVITPLSFDLPWLIVALFLLGLGWNISFVGASSLFADSLGPVGRGRAAGISEGVVAVATGLGSLGTGMLYAAGDMRTVGAFGCGLAGLLLLALLWVAWSERRATAPVATEG